jgi:hypothetical protein
MNEPLSMTMSPEALARMKSSCTLCRLISGLVYALLAAVLYLTFPVLAVAILGYLIGVLCWRAFERDRNEQTARHDRVP